MHRMWRGESATWFLRYRTPHERTGEMVRQAYFKDEIKVMLDGLKARSMKRKNVQFGKQMSQVASTRLFMLKAECPYIPPRSETEGEADFLHASSEDVLVRLLS